MLRRHFQLGRYFRIRLDTDRGLHHGRPIDVEKERLAESFLRVPPFVESIDDVLRDGLPEGKEWIVLCRRLAVLANIVSRCGHRLHGRAIAAEGLIRHAEWIPGSDTLRNLRSNCRAEPWL